MCQGLTSLHIVSDSIVHLLQPYAWITNSTKTSFLDYTQEYILAKASARDKIEKSEKSVIWKWIISQLSISIIFTYNTAMDQFIHQDIFIANRPLIFKFHTKQ